MSDRYSTSESRRRRRTVRGQKKGGRAPTEAAGQPPLLVERAPERVLELAAGFNGDGVLWSMLCGVMHALEEGMTLLGAQGEVLFENAALGAMLEAEPDADRLRDEIEVLGRSVKLVARNGKPAGPAAPLQRSVGAGETLFQMRGLQLYRSPGSGSGPVLVIVHRVDAAPLSDQLLRDHFRLTPRQIDVARLLAKGQSNVDIAHELVISPHTARHHVESILKKLNVSSRVAARGIIQGVKPVPGSG